jgi:SAM-dependent methyltransferase
VFMASALASLYAGRELDLFALAKNWKRYIKHQTARYTVGEVLEVGAGIGSTTIALHDGTARRWVCLEPDPNLAIRLKNRLASASPMASSEILVGSVRTITGGPCFDCVLYVDVLEHIEDDRSEIQTAARLVRPSGYLVILSPAHQWLFSEFDRSIGHFRRYARADMRALMPNGWSEEKLVYMDSIGVLLSLANVIGLRRSIPTESQILLWDQVCVPISRLIDRLCWGRLGKSVLAVWRRKH